jgi:ubiquinone/menaquinone biosynthesis C-methylase UbiE
MDKWNAAMSELMKRRVNGDKFHQPGITNYANHISKIKIGDSVLDIGCGDMLIQRLIPKGVRYVGIDPFPVNENVLNMKIEECIFDDNSFDTTICFATLDGTIDYKKALKEIKRVTKKNAYFLTGIGIEVDKYHTHKIDLNVLKSTFKGWTIGVEEWLHPKVLLIEFICE